MKAAGPEPEGLKGLMFRFMAADEQKSGGMKHKAEAEETENCVKAEVPICRRTAM